MPSGAKARVDTSAFVPFDSSNKPPPLLGYSFTNSSFACASPWRTPLVYPMEAALSTLRSMRSRTPASAASTTRRICSPVKEAPSSLWEWMWGVAKG